MIFPDRGPLQIKGDGAVPIHVTNTVSIPEPSNLANTLNCLLVESGISVEVAAERGYYGIEKVEDFPAGFGRDSRRVPALGIPVMSPSGESFTRVRHSNPRPTYIYKKSGGRKRKGEAKYDQPAGQRIILDVHPRNAESIKDVLVPLWITEGEKKADCLTSRGQCVIALFGVDCWGKGGELLPDWDHVALNSRRVYVAYDSDVMVKPQVQSALARLAVALRKREAEVMVVYLPDAADGSKQGVDDYLVAGGTVDELYAMAQPFEEKTYVGERLSRNKRLKLQIEAVWKTHDSLTLERNGHYTRKAVYRVLVEEAEKHGKTIEEGVTFFLSSYVGALAAGVAQKTFSNHVRALGQDGYLSIERPDDPTLANIYTLLTTHPDNPRAFGTHIGESGAEKTKREGRGGEARRRDPVGGVALREYQVRALKEETRSVGGETLREYQARGGARDDVEGVPELRWSRTVMSWRVDASGVRHHESDYQGRLGKRRGAILYHLVRMGTEGADLLELTLRFGGEGTRPRDFPRRWLHQMDGTDGGPQLIEIGEDGRVRAVRDWREALENARTAGKEQEAQDAQLKRYGLQREAFHRRNETVADRAPTQAEMDRKREERMRDRSVHPTTVLQEEESVRDRVDHPPTVPQEEDADLKEAVRGYLLKNPSGWEEAPAWISMTLWAYGLYPRWPDPQKVEEARNDLRDRRVA
jgi:DNA-binding transcriptional ArsR family regulator